SVPPAGGTRYMPIELGALAAAFGVDPTTIDWRPELYVSPQKLDEAAARWREKQIPRDARDDRPARDDSARRRVLVNVSAGTAIRQWQVEKYAAVIAHIRKRWPDATV